MNIPVGQQRPSFGSLLRHWRLARRVSQLALAAEAEISGRHLSFLETGRAQPSREMVQLLATVLDVPLAEQNNLLVAAGYAPIYGERELSTPELDHVRRALEFILKQQEPYPAIVFDGEWNITARNDAANRIFSLFRITSATGRKEGRNAIRTIFHPEAMRQFIVNWEEYAGPLMQTLHREAADGINVNAARLRDELLTYPGVPSRWRVADPLYRWRSSRHSRRWQCRATSRCNDCASNVSIRPIPLPRRPHDDWPYSRRKLGGPPGNNDRVWASAGAKPASGTKTLSHQRQGRV